MFDFKIRFCFQFIFIKENEIKVDPELKIHALIESRNFRAIYSFNYRLNHFLFTSLWSRLIYFLFLRWKFFFIDFVLSKMTKNRLKIE